MIISRTPFRISFFGGGTDYHAWYEQHGGAVLSATIDKYCYLNCRFLPPFFEHKSRLVWSQIENVSDHGDIQHPVIRTVLAQLGIERGVEIHHNADLPARSGLGSSSSFSVGLLLAAHALQGHMVSKRALATAAIQLERDVLRENVGVQDQIAAAFGGLNRIDIATDGSFEVRPLIVPRWRLADLQSRLMLFFTGVSRTASEIAADQIAGTSRKQAELARMMDLVGEGERVLASDDDLAAFGDLLHETWMLKRGLTAKIAPAFIDSIYDRARAAGAIGGKLLGAGGGGFMVFFVDPDRQPDVAHALRDLVYVPFAFETGGAQLIYYNPRNDSDGLARLRHRVSGSDSAATLPLAPLLS
jgi:D-glycero-alpha-D-manno-heptose-7-phosphate kinase